VSPTDTLTEGFRAEKPDPPIIVTNAAPEPAKPTEAFNITMLAAYGRSYESKDEQEDHMDFTETTTLRDAVEATEEIVFDKMQESATHK
jgi:hypothetical protein